MAPFRPSNLNKRLYPGNANVIGPTIAPTVGYTTTTCCSSTNTCGACLSVTLNLGCRYGGGCACPCCNICCSCPCTVCDRTVPSGMWRSSEVYNARQRDSWGDDSCSAGAATCLCCTDVGYTCPGAGFVDYRGFFICCSGATKWFVAPACAQVNRTWGARNDGVTFANTCVGACSWFVPSCTQMQNPGYTCRAYWDSYCTDSYWSTTEYNAGAAWAINMANGGAFYRTQNNFHDTKNYAFRVRAFRTI